MEQGSFFLFARPSFLEGIARLFDFSNSLNVYNEVSTGREADGIATWIDWNVVGQDLWGAIELFENEESLALAQ